MSKILVTGGAGFIGSHIVDRLISLNHDVCIVDNLSTGNLENINTNAHFYDGDIRNLDFLKKIFKENNPEFLIHAAAQVSVSTSVKNPILDTDVNIVGSLNILELCKNFDIKKIIFSSTGGAIYGDTTNLPTPETEKENPVSPYGISKLTVEKYIQFYSQIYGLNYTILRYSNVYGPRQNSHGEAGVVAIFKKLMQEGNNPIIYGDGTQTRDYIHVNDIVNINVKSIENGSNEIYNVGTGMETKTINVFNELNKNFGCKYVVEFKSEREGDIKKSCLDNNKIKEDYKINKFINFSEGVKSLF